MVKVMASGVFDILHLGHVYYLTEARKLGDELIVVVARDSTARKLKHQPIMNEDIRVRMVESLKPVDRAILGHEDDMYKTVLEIKPDIIAIGYDQNFNENEITENCKRLGLDVRVVRIPQYTDSDLNGTRKIIGKILSAYAFQKEIEQYEEGREAGENSRDS
ncbi:MAG: adenylyltransferase/cytidyltransferase family protein [Thermoplasmata archaeon]